MDRDLAALGLLPHNVVLVMPGPRMKRRGRGVEGHRRLSVRGGRERHGDQRRAEPSN